MDVRSLPNEVRSLLRSGSNINDVSHCVQELVFNSLDAKSTAIAVRINLKSFRIQVVDNGRGISKFDMGFIGLRHMTSKCQTLQDLTHQTKYYGFRGEALASIANVSEKLTITSKLTGTDCTYSKVIENKQFSDVVQVKDRAEHGTTITVENFLYNLPVRQKRIKADQGVEDVKNNLELLVIIHPKVTFSLRNDINLKVVLKVNQSDSILQSFINLHPEINIDYMSFYEVSKGKISVSGLIYKKSHVNQHLQFIYVNKRLVASSKIRKTVKRIYKEAHKHIEFLQIKDYPVYILNIACPYSEVDLIYNSSKIHVEFKHWDVITKCVEKLFYKGWRINSVKNNKEQEKVDVISNTGISISNMLDVVKSRPFKRKVIDISNSSDDNQEVVIETSALQPVINKKKKSGKSHFLLVDTQKQKNKNDNHQVLVTKQKHKDDENSHEEIYKENSPMNMRLFRSNNKQQERSVELVSNREDKQLDTEDQSQGKNLIMNYFLKSAMIYKDDDNENKGDIFSTYTSNSQSDKSPVCLERMEKNFCTTEQYHNTSMTCSLKLTTDKIVNKQKPEHNMNFNTALSTLTFNNTAKKKRGERLNKVCYTNNSNVSDSKNFKLNKYVQTSFSNDYFIDTRKRLKTKAVQTDPFLNKQEWKDDVNTFNYHLSEEQGWEEHYQEQASNIYNPNKRYFYHDEKTNTVNRYTTPSFRKANNDIYLDIAPEDITFCFQQNLLQNFKSKPEELNCMQNVCHRFQNYDFFSNNHQANSIYQDTNNTATAHPFIEEISTVNLLDIMNNVHAEEPKRDASLNISLFSLDNITVSPRRTKRNIADVSRYFVNSKRPHNNKCNRIKSKSFPVAHFGARDHCRDQQTQVFSFPTFNNDTFVQPLDDFFKIKQLNEPDVFEESGNSGKNICDVIEKQVNEEQEISTKLFKSGTSATEPLLFSIKENDRDSLLKSDLDLDKQINEKQKEYDCDFANLLTQEKVTNNIFESSAEEDRNVFNIPKKENTFVFKQRLDLLPIGSSPIMSAYAKVDKILSPNSKEFLHETILKHFEDELQSIKWQNYLNNKNLSSFFNELYRQKARQFEKAIPKVPIKKISSRTTYSRNIFDNIDMLFQLDKKFIVALDKDKKQLYIFDQHAVHERIRVEMLFKEYRCDKIYQSVPRYLSTHCKQNIYIELNYYDLKIITAHRAAFDNVGLEFHVSENVIKIMKVPQCFQNKAKRTHSSAAEKTLECLVKGLLFEMIETLKSTQGCLVSTPSIISDVINSEACRGSIKFGDTLTYPEMKHYLIALGKCNLPFQCAHGRPTVAVVNLQEHAEKFIKPNLRRLSSL